MRPEQQGAIAAAVLWSIGYVYLSSWVVAAFAGREALPRVARSFIHRPWRGPLAHIAILRALPTGVLAIGLEAVALMTLLLTPSAFERAMMLLHFGVVVAWSVLVLYHVRRRRNPSDGGFV